MPFILRQGFSVELGSFSLQVHDFFCQGIIRPFHFLQACPEFIALSATLFQQVPLLFQLALCNKHLGAQ
eukprot:7590400-Karenia_brevis.AAC.1